MHTFAEVIVVAGTPVPDDVAKVDAP